MLRFKELVVTNFGPFKGVQKIDFSDAEGITIVWGDNGRGKTTLLNIIRYALYGTYYDRRGGKVDCLRLLNLEAKEEKDYKFGVSLKMINDGDEFELTRSMDLRKGVSSPRSNDDYVEEVFLRKNNIFLSSEMQEHELRLIMPSEVSRFFLFDGELLAEYEELLMQDSTTGASIKDSIEQILGVPVLTNGATDVAAALDDYRKRKNIIAQSNSKTQKIAAQIAALEAEKTEHSAEIARLKAELDVQQSIRDSLIQASKQSEHITELVAQLKNVEELIDNKEREKEEVRQEILQLTRDAWKDLAMPRVEAILEEVEGSITYFQNKDQTQRIADHFIKEMKMAARDHHCPLCDQDISEEKLDELLSRISGADHTYGGLTEGERDVLQNLQARRMNLKKLQGERKDIKELLLIHERRYSDLEVDISDAKARQKEIRSQLAMYGNVESLSKDIQDTAKKLAACMSKIDVDKEAIGEEQKKYDETLNALTVQETKLKNLSSDDDTRQAIRRFEVCKKISNIFEEGIGAYRDRLKERVEEDATKLFLRLRSDEDYISLKINDNYGLSIVHKSGALVPLRSSGYEHIVALSLIGALHNNAPLRGPIIMDSPFGRLSTEHKKNVVKMLPEMSDQIVLLAYTDEIDEQYARRILSSKLREEYRLERKSSFNTQIRAI